MNAGLVQLYTVYSLYTQCPIKFYVFIYIFIYISIYMTQNHNFVYQRALQSVHPLFNS